MSKRDLFGDEVPEASGENFANLFKDAGKGALGPKVGDTFRGEILSIGKDESFVATGGPTDGIIPTQDLKDDKGEIKFRVGESLDVTVVKIKGTEVRLKRKDSRNAVGELESLEDAFDMELPIEGRVVEAVKGGFRVNVMGKMGFCPISQMEIGPIHDAAEYANKKFEFVITKLEEDSRGLNIVVSRRRLLEQLRAEKEGEFMESAKVGDIFEGRISRLEPFGAFVEIEGGVEGLIHISELTWGRVKHPSEVISTGNPVRVKLIKIDDQGDRMKISFSLKQGGGEMDPWTQLEEKFPIGSTVDGEVDKKEVYGLFVRIAPGITGLLPKSKWRESEHANTFEGARKGDKIKVRIDQIMHDEHKISLGVPGEAVDESWREHNSAGGKSSGFGAGAFGNLADLLKKK